jgi:hypothetical protein
MEQRAGRRFLRCFRDPFGIKRTPALRRQTSFDKPAAKNALAIPLRCAKIEPDGIAGEQKKQIPYGVPETQAGFQNTAGTEDAEQIIVLPLCSGFFYLRVAFFLPPAGLTGRFERKDRKQRQRSGAKEKKRRRRTCLR